jgi:membrane-associated phospholipid phosphatase
MSDLQKWIASFVLTVMLVVICYLWLDRPVALLAHQTRQLVLLDPLPRRIPVLVAPLAGAALLVLAVRAFMRRPLTRHYVVLLLCSLSFFVAEGLKTYLKTAFGRTWPESWMGPHISFIRDGAYGFNPFHGGPAYTDFPSGHMMVVCAVVSVLWACYPKFRPLYILCVVVTAALLVVTNFHFVSDIIAGTFLGISVGWITMAMWRAGIAASVASSIDQIRGSNPSDDTGRGRILRPPRKERRIEGRTIEQITDDG